MKQMDIDILNFENRILQDRRVLNDLIFQYQQQSGSKDEIIEAKIHNMQIELDYMNNQWNALLNAKNAKKDIIHNIQKETVESENLINEIMPMQTVQNNIPQNHNGRKDYENIVGKSWMGAIASILIFISLIMFATLFVPILTDTLKMVVMFTVSIALTLFGLIKNTKNPKNTFYLALSACGIGAIYISLLLSNVYFKAMNDIALYILILVWAVFVSILSKNRNTLFQVIGQSGILIAVILGSVLCIRVDDSVKFIVLTVFFILSSVIFMIANYQKNFSANMIGLIFNHINAWIILITCILLEHPYMSVISAAFMMFYIAILIGLSFLHMQIDKKYIFGIINILNIYQFTRFMYLCIDHDILINLLIISIGIVAIIFTEWKFDKTCTDKKILQIFSVILTFSGVVALEGYANIIGIIILGILLLSWGYYKNDKVYLYSSAIYILVSIVETDGNVLLFALTMLYFVCYFTFSIRKKEQYNMKLKIIEYVLCIIAVYGLKDIIANLAIGDEAIKMIPFMALCIANMIAMKGRFVMNYCTGQKEKASEITTYVMNVYLMVSALKLIADIESTIWLIVAILFAVMIFSANSANLLQRYQGEQAELKAGIYIGLKFTILLVTILSSLEVANLAISIICFLFAIAVIVIGFRFLFKSLRIYGLVISIISVFKLIMIDISYEDMLERAVGFFICGILCFAISLIYNKIDKKL